MSNSVILVGRLFEKKILKEDEKGIKNIEIIMNINRNYKNDDGVYESDLINVKLIGGVAESTFDYCNNGDVIGLKGRIENKNGKLEIIGEKVTFLSSRKKEEN